MRTLTAQAQAAKAGQAYRVVYWVQIDADVPGGATSTRYYAHRRVTISGQAYTDGLDGQLAPFRVGIQPQASRVRPAGGLAAVGGFSLALRNEAQASDLIDSYYLENDTVRWGLVFIDGAEVAADMVTLGAGVIDNYPWDLRTWTFDVIDSSDRDLVAIPRDRVELVTYPYAPLDALGKAMPFPFGQLNRGPAAQDGTKVCLAPCRCVDDVGIYTAGENLHTWGTPYQVYSGEGRAAEILSYTRCDKDGTAAPADFYFKVNDGTRKLCILAALPTTTNNVAAWRSACDNNSTTYASIVNGEDLDLYFGGVGKLGELSSVKVKVLASAGFDYKVYTETVTPAVELAAGSATGDKTIDLSADIATYWKDGWGFCLLSLEIDGTGAANIKEIWLELEYADKGAATDSSLDVGQAIKGFRDTAAYYRDGAAIVADGTLLENPVHILQAILRAKRGYNRLVADIDTASFAAADDYRTAWKFAFGQLSTLGLEWLNEFGFQAGLHIFRDSTDKWKVIAQDTGRACSHAFIWDHNVAVRPGSREPDVSFGRTPIRDIINEIALRYRRSPFGQYEGLVIKSGKYRYSGTCSASSTTSKLTDLSATFQTGATPARVGETVYVENDQEYTIAAVDSDTVLSVTPVEYSAVNDNTAASYWAGPNLSGAMVRSQSRYKTENPLGAAWQVYESSGGYASDFVQDDATATLLVNRLVTWRAQRRFTAELTTFLNAADVEPGDLAYLEHSWLPDSQSAPKLGELAEAIAVDETVWTMTDDADWGGARSWRVNDYAIVDHEVVKVTEKDDGAATITVSRAQCNTAAAVHASGGAVYRLTRKWEIVGVQPVPDAAAFRLELQQTPYDYTPVGLCVADASPDWDAATTVQRYSSGWCSYNSGRMVDTDEDSALSHCGAD